MARHRRNADGYYRASVVIGYNEKGNQRRKTVKAKTVRELDIKLADLKAQVNGGINFDVGKVTVEQWGEKWLETYHGSETKNDRTFRANARLHIFPDIGLIPIANVKTIQLQDILNAHAGQSKSHIHKIQLCIAGIFGSAVKNKIIIDNPADDIELPACTTGTHRPITDIERHYILKLAETHRAGLWVKTLLYCGLRPAETAALKWCDIHMESARMHVYEALEAGRNNVKGTKTDEGDRVIPIPAVLLDDLRKAERVSDYVFTQKTSNRALTQTSMRGMWLNFKRELDILMGATVFRNKIVESVVADDLSPYCLRHTYGTDLQDAGVPINVARYLMGHADIAVTSKIYTHQTEGMTAETESKINAFLSSGVQEGNKNINVPPKKPVIAV